MNQDMRSALEGLIEAIDWFAEDPATLSDEMPCHYGITDKWHCGRCGRGIAAWRAQQAGRKALEGAKA